jgi:hypothetical protein
MTAPTHVYFRCRHCNARLRAPLHLIGRYRSCPGCGQPAVVPARTLDESLPLLARRPPAADAVGK